MKNKLSLSITLVLATIALAIFLSSLLSPVTTYVDILQVPDLTKQAVKQIENYSDIDFATIVKDGSVSKLFEFSKVEGLVEVPDSTNIDYAITFVNYNGTWVPVQVITNDLIFVNDLSTESKLTDLVSPRSQ